jgi:hypothetical protein
LDLEDGLRRIVGTKVSIVEKNGKGKITIDFANNSQFENIVNRLKAVMKHGSDDSRERVSDSSKNASPSARKKRKR